MIFTLPALVTKISLVLGGCLSIKKIISVLYIFLITTRCSHAILFLVLFVTMVSLDKERSCILFLALRYIDDL